MLQRHARICVTAVIAATLATSGAAQGPIAIALVRQDGFLIPIAEITEGLFTLSVDIKTTVNGEIIRPEKPDYRFTELRWTLFYGRDRKPEEIKTLEQVPVPMPYCVDRLAWRTTLKLPPAPENEAPIRKIGIAVRGTSVEHPEDVVNQPDAASRRVARHIVQLSHAKEDERIKDNPEHFPGVSRAERTREPVRLRKMFRHAFAGVATYYFEAVKPFRGRDGTVYPEQGLITGWVKHSAAGLTDHDVAYKISDDAYKEGTRATVWGVVRYRDRALWLVEWHGWESEYYTLHDWPSGVVRLTIDGYDC